MIKNIKAVWDLKKSYNISPMLDLIPVIGVVMFGFAVHFAVGIWAFWVGVVIGVTYGAASLVQDYRMGKILLEEGEEAMWSAYDNK